MTAQPRKTGSAHYDPEAHPKDGGDLPLFPMARASDPDTSHKAAGAMEPHVSGLQRRVLDVFAMQPPMTAKEAEALDVFADLGFSTVRKRCSELVAGGFLEPTGDVRDRCAVLRVKA